VLAAEAKNISEKAGAPQSIGAGLSSLLGAIALAKAAEDDDKNRQRRRYQAAKPQ